MRIMLTQGHGAALGDVGSTCPESWILYDTSNNTTATAAIFTEDGWFVTGDRVFIDNDGNLNIDGREKEFININGIKYFPHEIETALENANIAGLTPSYTALFSYRPPNSHAEKLCVVYNPNFDINAIAARVDTARSIVLVVGSFASTRPKQILPLPRTLLHKSALGKLSRTKVRKSFQHGAYDDYEDSKDPLLESFRAKQREHASTPTEHAISAIMRDVADLPEEELGVDDSLFELGVTSTGLFILKRRIEEYLRLESALAVGILLTIPTIRGITSELEKLGQDSGRDYNPVVPLQSN